MCQNSGERFGYRDGSGAHDGVEKVRLKQNKDFRTKFVLISEGACWADEKLTNISKNNTDRFKAKE